MAAHEDRLRKSAATLALLLEEELDLLRQLTEFELGRFLLRSRGLNGYWTAWLILHGPELAQHPLEQWLVHEAPTVCATRERFGIFRQQLNAALRPGASLCSVPCGLMDDLLGLDDEAFPDLSLTGIDPDPDSLQLAA
ncbi:MAG: hypothetical protein M3O22_05760 [Pseudomonadota bacterium]|nr:hypothetical protein [Pseudomonadota bacterium]